MQGLEKIMEGQTREFENKTRIVAAMILPVILHGCETWTQTMVMEKKMYACEMWIWRRMLIADGLSFGQRKRTK